MSQNTSGAPFEARISTPDGEATISHHAAFIGPEGSGDFDAGAPIIRDPGAAGWADEPKVSAGERVLYGELAGVVRLQGQAATAAEEAYSLACKHLALQEEYGLVAADPAALAAAERELDALRSRVIAAWELNASAQETVRDTAKMAIVSNHRRFTGNYAPEPTGRRIGESDPIARVAEGAELEPVAEGSQPSVAPGMGPAECICPDPDTRLGSCPVHGRRNPERSEGDVEAELHGRRHG